ncbi:MAG: hypothetical protein EBX03_07040 [Rhodobacteraceae bacterium]|nr:hypothetical protein [Rhodobacterales bacterium]NCW07139.1 hypothetical protein [Rhodobacterales bacterium]NCX28495.1 hypothetical protein [Rhodobacterales bacterium]NCX91357.1 hypothetical protein [Paracoccaceae bacterium]
MIDELSNSFVFAVIFMVGAVLLCFLVLYLEARRLRRCPVCRMQSCDSVGLDSKKEVQIWKCSECSFVREEPFLNFDYRGPFYRAYLGIIGKT